MADLTDPWSGSWSLFICLVQLATVWQIKTAAIAVCRTGPARAKNALKTPMNRILKRRNILNGNPVWKCKVFIETKMLGSSARTTHFFLKILFDRINFSKKLWRSEYIFRIAPVTRHCQTRGSPVGAHSYGVWNRRGFRCPDTGATITQVLAMFKWLSLYRMVAGVQHHTERILGGKRQVEMHHRDAVTSSSQD